MPPVCGENRGGVGDGGWGGAVVTQCPVQQACYFKAGQCELILPRAEADLGTFGIRLVLLGSDGLHTCCSHLPSSSPSWFFLMLLNILATQDCLFGYHLTICSLKSLSWFEDILILKLAFSLPLGSFYTASSSHQFKGLQCPSATRCVLGFPVALQGMEISWWESPQSCLCKGDISKHLHKSFCAYTLLEFLPQFPKANKPLCCQKELTVSMFHFHCWSKLPGRGTFSRNFYFSRAWFDSFSDCILLVKQRLWEVSPG